MASVERLKRKRSKMQSILGDEVLTSLSNDISALTRTRPCMQRGQTKVAKSMGDHFTAG